MDTLNRMFYFIQQIESYLKYTKKERDWGGGRQDRHRNTVN